MPPPDRSQVQASPAAPSEAPRETLALVAEIQPTTVRVQQQAILTTRVYTPEGGALPHPQLYDPRVAGASVLPLGEDYAQATRDGRPHQVYERRYAIFPSQAGTLTLDPLVVDAWILVPGQTAPTQQRARSNALSLKVEAAPKLDSGRTWLPAKGVALSEPQTGLAQMRPGGVWQRLITLTVTGQAAATLPELIVAAPHQLDTRHDRPRLWDERTPEGVVGTRQEVILVSGSEQAYRLPEVRLDWWNIAAGAWETAVLPPRDLQVLVKTPASPIPSGAPTALPDSARRQDSGGAGASADSNAGAGVGVGPWIWGLVVLGLGAVILVRRRRRIAVVPARVHPTVSVPAPTAPSPPSPLEQFAGDVRVAYESGNAGAARAALLAWAEARVAPQPARQLDPARPALPGTRRPAHLLIGSGILQPGSPRMGPRAPVGGSAVHRHDRCPRAAAGTSQAAPPGQRAAALGEPRGLRALPCRQRAVGRPHNPRVRGRPEG